MVTAVLALVGFLALPAVAAAAHPLGNFSVNRYAGLTVHPDRIEALVVADLAELPTLQESAPSCDEAADALRVSVGGVQLRWKVLSDSLTYAPGAGGLRTSRLECRLSAPADISGSARVEVANGFRDDRIGWREIVAAGSGVRLSDTSLPSASVSNELRTYPSDPLASPADVRSASFTAAPGEGSAAAPVAVAGSGRSGLLAGAERRLEDLVGGERFTPLVGLLAVLLSLVLGAAHAALPGHGKTVMAAYLAGSRGRPRDAVLVGATVTFTHTAGVIALGLLLTAASGVAGESVLGYLGLASGVLVTAVGVGALISAVRRYRASRAVAVPAHAHSHHDATHSHAHSHDDDATLGHAQSHNDAASGDALSHDEVASGHAHSHDSGLLVHAYSRNDAASGHVLSDDEVASGHAHSHDSGLLVHAYSRNDAASGHVLSDDEVASGHA
ncbi:hypothetical protein JIG36_32565, partial [Actinoplanes sp. LDG1-06]|nr:hypothetical protein [Actinoplanes ovalisporus]